MHRCSPLDALCRACCQGRQGWHVAQLRAPDRQLCQAQVVWGCLAAWSSLLVALLERPLANQRWRHAVQHSAGEGGLGSTRHATCSADPLLPALPTAAAISSLVWLLRWCLATAWWSRTRRRVGASCRQLAVFAELAGGSCRGAAAGGNARVHVAQRACQASDTCPLCPRLPAGVERRINLSSIRTPRVGGRDRQPEPWAMEGKEFLRWVGG